MLTREQKIDFLKCCIATYEDERVLKELPIRCRKRIGLDKIVISGYCSLLVWYGHIIIKNDIGFNFLVERYFSEFYEFIKPQRNTYFHPYFWAENKYWYELRAKLAREFLKQEYGITVPKRKK